MEICVQSNKNRSKIEYQNRPKTAVSKKSRHGVNNRKPTVQLGQEAHPEQQSRPKTWWPNMCVALLTGEEASSRCRSLARLRALVLSCKQQIWLRTLTDPDGTVRSRQLCRKRCPRTLTSPELLRLHVVRSPNLCETSGPATTTSRRTSCNAGQSKPSDDHWQLLVSNPNERALASV